MYYTAAVGATLQLALIAQVVTAAPLPQNPGKKGIAYKDASLLKAFAGKISWVHNWEQSNAGVPSGMAYYPTLWNGDADRIKMWKANADAAIARGDNVLFSFNEPIQSFCPGNPDGHQVQACMTATEAAKVWKEQIMQYKGKATLVAPSVPQGDEGAQWLTDFIRACPKEECGWSALNLHWYEKANKIDYFKQYFTDAHDNSAYGNADIWVGEFKATEGSDEEKKKFYQDAVTWMESQPWIKGYAAFWAEEMAPGGTITPVGAAYAG